MSYCRFGWAGSEVYVYDSTRGLVCCFCHLSDEPSDHIEGYRDDDETGRRFACERMIVHLMEHKRAGHTVPSDAIEALAEEAKCH